MIQRVLCSFLVVATTALTLSTAPPAGSFAIIDFSFDECEWRLQGGWLHAAGGAMTELHDLNGGCKSMIAYLRYFNHDENLDIWRKRCWKFADPTFLACRNHHTHHQSKGLVQSWGTFRWQSSGWRF